MSLIRATFKPEKQGHFLTGIPAKDLTEDQYRALSNAQRKAIRDSGLWDVLSDREMAELAKSARPARSSPAPETDSAAEQEDD